MFANGGLPVDNSCAKHPNDQTSISLEYYIPDAISGETQFGVPLFVLRHVSCSDRKQEKPRPADRNLNVPKFSIPHSTVDVTPYPPTVGKPLRGKEQQTDEKSFLLKLMENMRAGFQDQIDEIKNEIRQRGPSQDKLPQPAQKTAEVSNAAIQSLLGSYQTNTAQPSLAHYHYLLAQQLANQSYPRLSC